MNANIWLEIYFDAEDVHDISKISEDLKYRWKIIEWQLDGNGEPIIESCRIIYHSMDKITAQDLAKAIKTSSPLPCIISNDNPSSKFPIRSIRYELLGYDLVRLRLNK